MIEAQAREPRPRRRNPGIPRQRHPANVQFRKLMPTNAISTGDRQASEASTVLTTLVDGVATLMLNRPERLNALTRQMEGELHDAFMDAAFNPDVRVIILTGAGRAFCAGMDMDELKDLPPDDISDPRRMRPFDMERRADYQTRYAYFQRCEKPVIAAVNGAAAGLGFVFALCCDLRFCAPQAVFSTAFSRRGLIAEHGIAWLLREVAGPAVAADLLFSARRIGAEEALRIGLVNGVAPGPDVLQMAQDYARDLAGSVSPRSLRVMKRQLSEAPFQTLAEAVALANREMKASFESADFVEGVAHFLEKRAPRFTGR
jgi:enoyl-CoA hydratase/carnithine racemase